MKHNQQTITAQATLTFEFSIDLEDGEDKKRALYEEALGKIDPPFDGWFLEVEEL
jgi:hypothetical protein